MEAWTSGHTSRQGVSRLGEKAGPDAQTALDIRLCRVSGVLGHRFSLKGWWTGKGWEAEGQATSGVRECPWDGGPALGWRPRDRHGGSCGEQVRVKVALWGASCSGRGCLTLSPVRLGCFRVPLGGGKEVFCVWGSFKFIPGRLRNLGCCCGGGVGVGGRLRSAQLSIRRQRVSRAGLFCDGGQACPLGE